MYEYFICVIPTRVDFLFMFSGYEKILMVKLNFPASQISCLGPYIILLCFMGYWKKIFFKTREIGKHQTNSEKSTEISKIKFTSENPRFRDGVEWHKSEEELHSNIGVKLTYSKKKLRVNFMREKIAKEFSSQW